MTRGDILLSVSNMRTLEEACQLEHENTRTRPAYLTAPRRAFKIFSAFRDLCSSFSLRLVFVQQHFEATRPDLCSTQ